ncbi:SMP-30/gluconolactonase/LRE family protein [Motilibacter aurantiacus]|uniref:SMP-30/gluconolactonase/LRE family protein n=1 Tax=Motilibacter aurantiacus TaxID=2714955 RepID=UPI00140CE3F2|nr:SMP-30/gluconolactonase/LRE family protein [Motilibacter aurantiacus]NHC46757.1 SMP-30/gluconolactonase/LRE family protein [Motilibacter aurantiacus]
MTTDAPPPASTRPDPVSAEVAELGEGPRWDAARSELLWVDIPAGTLRRAGWEGGRLRTLAEHRLDVPLGAAAPAESPDGGWLLAAGTGLSWLSAEGGVRELAQPEAGRDVRMNDAACDPAGRLWAGTMAYDERAGAGRLARCDLDGSVQIVGDGFTVPNGFGWSPDGRTMYHADSGHKVLRAYPFDVEGGSLGDPRVVVDFGDGPPADGITVDDEGTVWAALYGGGEVRRYDPSGRVLAVVAMPVSQPTAPCFGPGTTLFVTTTRQGLSPEQLAAEPDAGRVFAVDVGVGGPPVRPFRGALPTRLTAPPTHTPAEHGSG